MQVPGSKSLTNRHLLLAGLAEAPSTLHHPLCSRDTELMLGALARLGVGITRAPDDAWWRLDPPVRLRGGAAVDCGLAGTVLRFVPPVAALADGPVAFDGDPRARSRPIAPLLTALHDLGVHVDHAGRQALPFTVHGTGRVPGGEVAVDSSASSQFISALLLAGARFERGVTVRHTGDRVPSAPHIAMTLQVLAEVGVAVDATEPAVWRVAPGPVAGREVQVEPDLSSAAPFLAAAAVTGGQVTVAAWPARTTQAGDHLRALLEQLGCEVALAPTGLSVTGPPGGRVPGVDLDLHDVGELTPVLAAVTALADGPSRLRGVAHLRGHETDRLAALEAELSRVGAEVSQTHDGLTVRPGRLRSATLRTYHDHRMVMAGAVLGLRVPGLRVQDAATAAKTFPGFDTAWEHLVTR